MRKEAVSDPAREQPDSILTTPTETHGGADIPAVPVPDEPPVAAQKIGRYTIRRVIGSGGMGTVYEAEQDQPKRVVALKVMRQTRSGVAAVNAMKRFHAEAQFLASLKHHGICQVYDAGVAEERTESGIRAMPFIALEYVPGAMSITTFAETRSLPLRTRIELFLKVVDAVDHGHSRGVIHRDLKPDNVLVNDEREPKIIDFGVARATGGTTALNMTATGQVIGTLQYMSPEQLAGRGSTADQRTDVYSLGVILFELVCGKSPYESQGVDLISDVIRHADSRQTKPTTVNPDLDRELETVVMTAIERDPVRRYGSARELGADLRRWLAGDPVHARRPSVFTIAMRRIQQAASRHRPFAVLVIIIAAMVIAQGLARIAPSTIGDLNTRWTSFGLSRNATDAAALADATVMIFRADRWLDEFGVRAGVAKQGRQATRAVLGLIAERLADAGAKAVVFDLEFQGKSWDDKLFNEALARTNARGVPVLCTLSPFPEGEPPIPDGLTEFRKWGRWGGADFMSADGALTVPAAVLLPDGRAIPGLAMATEAARISPKLPPRFAAGFESETINVSNDDPVLGQVRLGSYPVVIRKSKPDPNGEIEFPHDSFLAFVVTRMPTVEVASKRSVARELLEAPAEKLRAEVEDRVVFIGFAEDQMEVFPGVPNVFAHAAAYGALRQGGIRVPDGVIEWIAVGLSAMVAVFASLAGFGRPKRAAVSILSAAIFFSGLFLVAYQFHYLIGPAVPTLSYAVAAAFALAFIPSKYR